MLDYLAIEEANATLGKYESMLQRHLGDVHGLDVFEYSGTTAGGKPGKDEVQFLKALPHSDVIRDIKFFLEAALAEKANAKLILACLHRQLFPRSRYNFDITKKIFLSDILALLEEGEAVCCLSVFRAIRSISLRASFVPPAGQIVDSISAEEAGLLSLQSDLVRIAQYLSQAQSFIRR